MGNIQLKFLGIIALKLTAGWQAKPDGVVDGVTR